MFGYEFDGKTAKEFIPLTNGYRYQFVKDIDNDGNDDVVLTDWRYYYKLQPLDMSPEEYTQKMADYYFYDSIIEEIPK